ncbi:deoxyribonuclease IV [Criblamydia sequanensis]|uniref:Probable endonuclease 4 n=1 Tax=Candidatus Criblamydia sequanensis CRIB-18 TaxID=1437425 RepID=A0A090CXZ0_9BACT|nr:deoxyribonuclease IV [Criblamydia sequanensis]CDR32991.1 Endonuclease IV [Criblamydia sequanensis CRIB-18]
MENKERPILIGAHTSAAGGVHNALLEGVSIGASTIQLFTANQRQWKAKPLSKEQVDLFAKTLAETGLQEIMSHDSYLINLGSNNPEILLKSRQAFKEEIERCRLLNLTYLNFHPGAYTTSSEEECLETIVASILECQKILEDSPTRLLIETTAGQGTALGFRFEHIAYLVERLEKKVPIGVCMDTCHSFVAGYDLRTKDALDAMLKEFDRIVGLSHLRAFHLNDSTKGLGSRVDRHKPIGEGEIGLEAFRNLMNDERTRFIPKYLETPGGPELWKKEIALLKSLNIR